MKMLIVAVAVIFPVLVSAQVHRCLGSDDKTVILTDKPCAPSSSRGKINVPLSTELTPDERRQALAESQERARSDRLAAIQLMLANGKTGEARSYARTAEERAMVGSVEGAEAAQRKQAKRDQDEARMRESHERLLKTLRR